MATVTARPMAALPPPPPLPGRRRGGAGLPAAAGGAGLAAPPAPSARPRRGGVALHTRGAAERQGSLSPSDLQAAARRRPSQVQDASAEGSGSSTRSSARCARFGSIEAAPAVRTPESGAPPSSVPARRGWLPSASFREGVSVYAVPGCPRGRRCPFLQHLCSFSGHRSPRRLTRARRGHPCPQRARFTGGSHGSGREPRLPLAGSATLCQTP